RARGRAMIAHRIVAWCTRHAWLVIAIAIAIGAGGELARRALSRDVIPDLSDPQVVLVATWMDHPAPQLAGGVTQVLARGPAGVPSLGGDVQQVMIETRPYDLRNHRAAFSDVVAALGPALAAHPANLAALETLPVPPTGAPLRDLARIRLTDDLPSGVADLGG